MRKARKLVIVHCSIMVAFQFTCAHFLLYHFSVANGMITHKDIFSGRMLDEKMAALYNEKVTSTRVQDLPRWSNEWENNAIQNISEKFQGGASQRKWHNHKDGSRFLIRDATRLY